LTPFPAHDEAAVRDRFRGTLLGLATGEALGEPADFLTAAQIEERFGVITEMVGGGCHDVAPGETTDATQMMLCLARSLADVGGFDPEDIMRRYDGWFATHPRDVSLTVRTVLLSYRSGTQWDLASRRAFEILGSPAAGNGSLMRCAPIGLRYEVALGDEDRDLQLLNELGVLSDDLQLQMRVPRRLVERRCCLVAFLRGLFLGCGSVSAPGAPVHMEFTVEDPDLAAQVQGMLARLGLAFKLTERDRNVACYTKRSQTAADLFAVLGAHEACLRWEEHAVLGTVRENANRLANCDEANARRAAAAAERQAAAARALMASPDSSCWLSTSMVLGRRSQLPLASSLRKIGSCPAWTMILSPIRFSQPAM